MRYNNKTNGNIRYFPDKVRLYINKFLIPMSIVESILKDFEKKTQVKVKIFHSNKQQLIKIDFNFLEGTGDISELYSSVEDLNKILFETSLNELVKYGKKNNNKINEENIKQINKIFEKIKGKHKIDCMVGFSGGKDSTYLLYVLKEIYGLNVLAYHFDTGFVSQTAKLNIKKVVSKLGVELVIEKDETGLLKKIYSQILKIPTSNKILPICSVCSSFYESRALIKATSLDIPLVIMGYSPYQVGNKYEIPNEELNNLTVPEYLEGLISDDEKKLFWKHYKEQNSDKSVRLLYFFNAVGYNYDEIKSTVLEKGLLKRGDESPLHSNCYMNNVIMHFDSKFLNTYPYVFEFSSMIKDNSISIEEAKHLLVVLCNPDFMMEFESVIRQTLDRLKIKEKEIVYG